MNSMSRQATKQSQSFLHPQSSSSFWLLLTCNCAKAPRPEKIATCHYFFGNSKSRCRARDCDAVFVCTLGQSTGLTCMQRKITSKISLVRPGMCAEEPASGSQLVFYNSVGNLHGSRKKTHRYRKRLFRLHVRMSGERWKKGQKRGLMKVSREEFECWRRRKMKQLRRESKYMAIMSKSRPWENGRQ